MNLVVVQSCCAKQRETNTLFLSLYTKTRPTGLEPATSAVTGRRANQIAPWSHVLSLD
jgi:hypothetical protein